MDYSETSNVESESRIWLRRAAERARAQLAMQKDLVSTGLGNVAHAARQSTQHLRDRQHDAVAQYVDRAADGLDRFSTRLRERDVNELIDDVGRAARRQPALFIGGAIAIGLIGARLIKMRNAARRADSRDVPYAPIS